VQAVHDAVAPPLEYWPAAHSVHAASPLVLFVPSGQELHTLWPYSSW
jgi:hypothetical protein